MRRHYWLVAFYFFAAAWIVRKPPEQLLSAPLGIPGLSIPNVAQRLFDRSVEAVAPDAYRPLAAAIIYYASRLTGVDAYTLLFAFFFACLFATCLFLHFTLLRWLRPAGAFLAVVLYLLPLYRAGYIHTPTTAAENMILAAAIWLLAAGGRRDYLLAPLIVVGTWFRETAVYVAFAYFWARVKSRRALRAFAFCLLLVALWALSWLGIYLQVGHTEPYCRSFRLVENLRAIAFFVLHPWKVQDAAWGLIGVLHVAWVLAFLPRPRGPELLERLKWLVLSDIPPLMVLGKIVEVRLLLHLGLVLWPLAVCKLFPELMKLPASEELEAERRPKADSAG